MHFQQDPQNSKVCGSVRDKKRSSIYGKAHHLSKPYGMDPYYHDHLMRCQRSNPAITWLVRSQDWLERRAISLPIVTGHQSPPVIILCPRRSSSLLFASSSQNSVMAKEGDHHSMTQSLHQSHLHMPWFSQILPMEVICYRGSFLDSPRSSGSKERQQSDPIFRQSLASEKHL